MLPPLGVTLPSGSSLQGGTLSSDLTIVGPCPIPAFNSAAYGALATSNPTQPLPAAYPADKAFFTVTFFYNESPQ